MTELKELQNQTKVLKSDIDSYADGLSEGREARIYERYDDLNEDMDRLHSEYEDIESTISGLQEVIDLLNEMRS